MTALGGGVTLAQSGKPRTGNHSFIAWMVAAAIQYAILWWGGFFA
jgi:hypothetical protein